ncbi:MAG: LysM peptidoglycan-binding domain-containing protein [Lentisphaeria bacterium]
MQYVSGFTEISRGLILALLILATVAGCTGGPRLASGNLSPGQSQWAQELLEWHPGWEKPYISPLRSRRQNTPRAPEKTPALEADTAEGGGKSNGNVDEVILIPLEGDGQSASAVTQYTVQKGDTLSSLALQFYGDPKQWHPIWEANQDVLESPHEIYPGLTLDIPSAH